MVTLALSLGTGVGAGLAFTVFDNNTTAIPIVSGVISLFLFPLVGGWLSPSLARLLLYPVLITMSLAIAWGIDGPLSDDANAVGFVFVVGLMYGSLASAIFGGAWLLRKKLVRLRS